MTADTGTAATNIALIKGVYAAFQRGDLPGLLEYLSEDVDWGIEAASSKEVPWHGTSRGKSGAKQFFAALAKECVFPRFEPSGFLGSSDAVACQLTFDVVLNKNGRKASYNVLHYFTIKSGKITKWRGTEDTAHTKMLWNS